MIERPPEAMDREARDIADHWPRMLSPNGLFHRYEIAI
jgi:hypothetical protein